MCNPNRDRIAALGRIIYDTKLTLRFNALSEFSFKLPQSVDGGSTVISAYDKVEVKRQVFIEDVGYFVINSAVENMDGSVPVLDVTCESLEVEFLSKKVNVLSGTGRLYDLTDPTNTTPTGENSSIMGYILSLINNGVIDGDGGWSLAGNLDATLAAKYRTFDISDTTVYSFLMNDVEKAFECIFVFDTIRRKIHIKTLDEAVTNTNIFISYDNLVKETELSEMADEIATGLYVYGGDGLDIRSVNPTGKNIIYDFTYYKTTDWMSQELIDAVTNWEAKIASNLTNYNSQLANYLTLYNELAVLETEKAELDAEKEAAEIALKAAIESNIGVSEASSALNAKTAQVSSKQSQIDAKNSQIDVLLALISAINDELDIANPSNFTDAQRIELSRFMLENTYQNEHILVLDSFTPVEIQEAKTELYNQALSVLDRVSRPRYEFTVNSVNFVHLKEFSEFTNQISVALGTKITISTSSYPIESVLLELELSYDNPDDFSMTFSNRLRLDNGAFQYTDLLGQSVSTGASVSFNAPSWGNWANDYKNEVTQFITSALDASKNEVINSSGQEIIINAAGLRGRKAIGNGTFSQEEVWLTSNTLAFTQDGWNTASTAVGKIYFNNGTLAGYGIAGRYLLGNIIAGNQLTIQAGDGSFIVNELGTIIKNAKFSVFNSVNGGALIINPVSSLNILSIGQSSDGQTIANPNFRVTVGGEVELKGNLYAGSNYIKTDGTARIGALTISGSTATFTGDIYANKLVGTVDWSQITNVPLPANRVGSGYPGSYVGSGYSASNLVTGWSGSSGFINGNFGATYIQATEVLQANKNLTVYGSTYFGGSIQVSGYYGQTVGYSVQTPYGTRVLTFRNGILVNFT